MSQIQKPHPPQIIGHTSQGQPVVEIDGQVHIVNITPIQHYQPLQTSPTTYDRGFLELLKLLGIFLAACLIGVVAIRVLFPPVAGNQPIVVQPEKKPYYRKDCQPSGLFGWGQSCTEERGWQ